ncbi:fibronectin type III domain, partial [Striga asiatica]
VVNRIEINRPCGTIYAQNIPLLFSKSKIQQIPANAKRKIYEIVLNVVHGSYNATITIFFIPLNAKTKMDEKKFFVGDESLEKINTPLENDKKRTKDDRDVDGKFERNSHRKKKTPNHPHLC